MDEESADRRAAGGQKGVGAELGSDASFPVRLAKAKAEVAIKALDAEIEKGDEMRRKLIDDMEAVQGREDIMLQIEGGMARGKKPVTDAEIDKALMNEVMKEPVSKGVEFITDTDEGQQVLDDYNDKPIVSKKNRPSESGRTQLQAAPSSEGLNQIIRVRQSRVSLTQSDSTKKKKKNTDTLAKDFENFSNQPKYFIGSLAENLNAKRDGSKSEYATFETNLSFYAKDGEKVKIEFLQGTDEHAGTLHSLLDHYDTTKGVITAEDVF